MRSIRAFRADDLKKGQSIIIYGAGRYGELALRGLEAIGLAPIFFIDADSSRDEYLGYDIHSPDDAKEYKNDVFLVASLNYYNEIIDYLHSNGISNIYNIVDLLGLEYDESVLSEYAKDEKHCAEKYKNTVEYANSGDLVLNHCEVVLTEKCTLRCRDCANLMQYYKSPENISLSSIKDSLERLLRIVDSVLDIRLIGGEPFIYRDIYQVIDFLCTSDKVKRVSIYTNSTLIPDDVVLHSLKRHKAFVHMSNYGQVSRKKDELIRIFRENGINYYLHDYEEWYDVGNLEKRPYLVDQAKEIYNRCIMSKCYTLYRGKLYLCPRSAHGERLGAFANSEAEYVDLKDENAEENRKRVYRMITRSRPLTACYYCNGSSNDSKTIKAAVQMIKKDNVNESS